MGQGQIEVSVHIENSPEAVMNYVANVSNRPLYLGPLKSVTVVKGDPVGVGTKWKWTWVTLGMEFEGTGESLEYEPGKLYSFKTEGGIASTWTYRAEPDGEGTKLTIEVEYEVPTNAVTRLPAASVTERMKKSEAQRVAEDLQLILAKG